MNVLITGGAGFVGLNLAECLLARGDTVTLLDVASPPSPALEWLRALRGTLHFVRADVRDATVLADAMLRHQPGCVIHGAAMTAGAKRERTQAAAIFDVNLHGTLNVLAAASRAGVGRFVQLSSGSVYGAGAHTQTELVEDRDVPQPESLYAITKYAAERAALRHRALHGLDVVVARLSVVFGRWEYDTGVRDTLSPPLLLARLARAGLAARLRNGLPDDWIYARDAAEAVAALADARHLSHALYQVGTGRRWSPRAWCDLLRDAYPEFDYAFVSPAQEANVGGQSPPARPPFSVERLGQDTGFRARFDDRRAFFDWMNWRAQLHALSSEARQLF
jgi:nucleoside-diphosphate-sugar epimerase